MISTDSWYTRTYPRAVLLAAILLATSACPYVEAAEKKISQLPAAVAAAGTDQHEVNQGGTSKRLTNSQILSWMLAQNLTLSGTFVDASAVTLFALPGSTTPPAAACDDPAEEDSRIFVDTDEDPPQICLCNGALGWSCGSFGDSFLDSIADDQLLVGNGPGTYEFETFPNCNDATEKVDWTGSAFVCIADQGGAGAGGDIITEGDSNVEVIDAGLGQVDVDLDGSRHFIFTDDGGGVKVFQAENSSGPRLEDAAASCSNPTVIPDQSDADTGIGHTSGVCLVDEGNQILSATSPAGVNIHGGRPLNIADSDNSNIASLVPQANFAADRTCTLLDSDEMFSDACIEDAFLKNSGDIFDGDLASNDAAGPLIEDAASTSSNPTLVPNKALPGWGIGGGTSLSLITDGKAALTFDANQSATWGEGSIANYTLGFNPTGAVNPFIYVENGLFQIQPSANSFMIFTDTGTGSAAWTVDSVPAFSIVAGGSVTVTPAANDNDTSVATTAYAQAELTAYASDTATFTNKTFDAEGTGNTLTIPIQVPLLPATCQNATAYLSWSHETANFPAATCVTGSNTQKAFAAFDQTTDECIQTSISLPSDWTGAIDAFYKWNTSATSGSVAWCTQLICVADAETGDPAYPAQGSGNCVSDAAKGTTLQYNDVSDTGLTATDCAAGEQLYIRTCRDPNETGGQTDTVAADASLIDMYLILRRAL